MAVQRRRDAIGLRRARMTGDNLTARETATMPIRLVAAASILLAAAPATLAASPSEVVAEIYGNVGMESTPQMRHFFTDPARTKFEQHEAAFDRGDYGCIDFSVVVDGQDYDDEELERTLAFEETVSGADAQVDARFSLFDEPRRVVWTLRDVEGEWKVADVASPDTGWRLSEFDCE